MLRSIGLGFALLLASLPAAGCAMPDGMQEKFYDATRAYNRSLRWSDFDRAAEHLPDAAVDAFLDQHDDVSDKLVIIDYEMTRMKLDQQKGIAASRVLVRWHTDDSTIVRETVVDQAWQFWEGEWYLVDERRARGKPLTIFAESTLDESDEPVPDTPHPYLPGLDGFRDQHDIGLSPKEKRRRGTRKGKKERASRSAPAEPVASHSLSGG